MTRDLEKKVQDTEAEIVRMQGFLEDCAALKDCLYGAISPVMQGWAEKGLDSTFYEFDGQRSSTSLEWRITFFYPFHEMVDLVHRGKVLDKDCTPLLMYTVVMDRDKKTLTVARTGNRPDAYFPTVAGSPQHCLKDAEKLEQDMQMISAARESADAAVESLTDSVRRYCAERSYKFVETPHVAESAQK